MPYLSDETRRFWWENQLPWHTQFRGAIATGRESGFLQKLYDEPSTECVLACMDEGQEPWWYATPPTNTHPRRIGLPGTTGHLEENELRAMKRVIDQDGLLITGSGWHPDCAVWRDVRLAQRAANQAAGVFGCPAQEVGLARPAEVHPGTVLLVTYGPVNEEYIPAARFVLCAGLHPDPNRQSEWVDLCMRIMTGYRGIVNATNPGAVIFVGHPTDKERSAEKLRDNVRDPFRQSKYRNCFRVALVNPATPR